MSKQDQNNQEQEQSFTFDFSFPFATVVYGKVDAEHEPMTRKQEQYVNYPPPKSVWASIEYLTIFPSCFNEQSTSLENLALLPCPPQA